MNAVARRIGRVAATCTVVCTAALGSGALIASGAGASDGQIMAYGNAHNETQDGALSIVRAGSSVVVKITFTSGSSFDTGTNLQICASTSPFTSKVAGSNCLSTANGTLTSYNESGSSATETVTLPSAFTKKTAYLQVHADSVDRGTSNTSMGCPIAATPLYGSCTVAANDDVSLPGGGANGMLAIGGIAAIGLGYVAVRSRRSTRAAA